MSRKTNLKNIFVNLRSSWDGISNRFDISIAYQSVGGRRNWKSSLWEIRVYSRTYIYNNIYACFPEMKRMNGGLLSHRHHPPLAFTSAIRRRAILLSGSPSSKPSLNEPLRYSPPFLVPHGAERQAEGCAPRVRHAKWKYGRDSRYRALRVYRKKYE